VALRFTFYELRLAHGPTLSPFALELGQRAAPLALFLAALLGAWLGRLATTAGALAVMLALMWLDRIEIVPIVV
jgi:hypothetical protein